MSSDPTPGKIREYQTEDASEACRVFNATYPDHPQSAEELNFRDSHRDPKCFFQRLVSEEDGRMVGFGEHDQFSGVYHPRKFLIDLTVHPDHQGRGFGRTLYDRLLESLRQRDPLSVRLFAREDQPRARRFFEDRGYREDRRTWESWLDPKGFDFAPYAGHIDSVLAQGIEIKTFGELAGDPDRMKKLYDLDWEAMQTMPLWDAPTVYPYDLFVKGILENPNLLPEGFFIAVDQGQYVGLSNVWTNQENDDLSTGLTTTAVSHRRRGIALALKLKAVEFARQRGAPALRTFNDSTNRPMLSINERLGFVRQPAWVQMVRKFAEE
jgi:mycothiol synthase